LRYEGRAEGTAEASEVEERDTGYREMDDFIRAASERFADFNTINRAYDTVSALEAIANHLARIPGRKNLIWVSSGFPLTFGYDRQPTRYNLSPTRMSFALETERAAKAISNANVAVYPVDARGLMVANPPNFWDTIATMQTIAERTGGKSFYNRNDISAAIRSAMDDSRVTYVLGFYPTHGRWDGRFHELKVKVKRPIVRLRHRAGYYAAREEVTAEKERHLLLLDVARNPLDSTTLGLQIRVTQLEGAETPSVSIAVQADTREITLREDKGRYTGMIDLLYAQRAPDGRLVLYELQTLNLNLMPESYERIVRNGLVIRRDVDLKSEATELRVIVRDVPSGATGSVSIPIEGRSSTPPKR
jgi:hypothetical protein